MKDMYGDKITVNLAEDYDEDYDDVVNVVAVTFYGQGTDIPMHLSPEKARKLAKKIRKMADEVDSL